MVHRLLILSGLIISTTCSVLPLLPIQIQLIPIQHPQQQQVSNPNYSFSYEVNDEHTGDIKHQQETRHGGTVTGQYSLIQPDGIRRTVDYRADDARGFRASVNNDRDTLNRQSSDNRDADITLQWLQPQTSNMQITPQWPQLQTSNVQTAPQRSQLQTLNVQTAPQRHHLQTSNVQSTPQRLQHQTQNVQFTSQWPEPELATQHTHNSQGTPGPAMAISRSSIVQNIQSHRVQHWA